MSSSGNGDSSDSGRAGSTWISRLSWQALVPGSRTKHEESEEPVQDPDPSCHQVTDYQEGERTDIFGDRIQLGDPKSNLPADDRPATVAETDDINETAMGQNTDPEIFPATHQSIATSESLPRAESATVLKPTVPTVGTPEHGPNGSAKVTNKITRDANRAVAALSKTAQKHRNMILPNYYDQFPDAQPIPLLTLSGQENRYSSDTPLPGDASKIRGVGEAFTTYIRRAFKAAGSYFFPETRATTLTSTSGAGRDARGIQRVVIIGIHGWYPRKALRTVIGEPTGTSQKFCEEMDLALKDYLGQHNIHLDPERITQIPLEGEGKVLDRVELLYQSLIHRNNRWRQALKEADLVLVATHSQGTPTSIMLVAHLIRDGILRVHENDPLMQTIGILAMAGISHGPFPFLKGNLIMRFFEADAAKELFEFMDSETSIARKYQEGLRVVLSSGVKITCVASLEDQVVPLYSAVMTSIHHPSITRALFINGSSYQDDFLINLISFSLRLRNAGVDDHGILVHLSEAIAGSLYYGDGHSTIYEEREVYLLALRSLLEPPSRITTTKARSEPILHPFRAKQRLNPFYLPWGMRGLADDIKTRGDQVLIKELDRVRSLYNEWNPVSKVMKEIKFRLEPVRAKL
ncbi:hypothetical protein BGW38_004715 [Lunasporangiospora selenospora]|uniref:YMC020W-like alpha/beta hydrolase domain-containing protein n=1 Tax=Lunasporangiospora selenospora TaxID=979761 RepID=A0A9P6G300_9FUNG|nr:hypothetical protein BGW38_004715 [Lunasporangiospora selenospora]